MNDLTYLPLKRIFKKKSVRHYLNLLKTHFSYQFAIKDKKGKIVYGDNDQHLPQNYQISINDLHVCTICYNHQYPDILVSFLKVLLESELDKKSLTADSLNKNKELNLIYRLADKTAIHKTAEDICYLALHEIEHYYPSDIISIILCTGILHQFRLCATNTHEANQIASILKIHLPDKPQIHEGHIPILKYIPAHQQSKFTLLTPIKVQNKILGAICLSRQSEPIYTAADIKLLLTISSQIAAPIDNAMQFAFNQRLQNIIETLHTLSDIDSTMPFILHDAINFTNAEGGTIYLTEGNKHRYAYVQNKKLFQYKEAEVNAIYINKTLPIAPNSLAGYAAFSQKKLVIDDAYQIPDDAPYSFDQTFDKEYNYRTRSVYIVPLIGEQNNLVGVLQLINALDAFDNPIPFSHEHQLYVDLLTKYAVSAIEKSLMTRETILRMLKIAELRDPSETGAHVQRVGAYAAEIYNHWAIKHGVEEKQRLRTRGLIHLAAMLHDLGKVGISDAILKKPGRLTDEEFSIMKNHTWLGARLFQNPYSELDKLCYEVCLHHHEKWAGGGYFGRITEDISSANIFSPPKARPIQKNKIPFAARITAIADVYDALTSERCYKPAWPEDKVLSFFKKERGRQFDPELIDIFFEIYPVIKAIRQRYGD